MGVLPLERVWYPVFIWGPSVPRSHMCLVELEKKLVTHSPVLPEAEEGTTRTGGGGYQCALPRPVAAEYILL